MPVLLLIGGLEQVTAGDNGDRLVGFGNAEISLGGIHDRLAVQFQQLRLVAHARFVGQADDLAIKGFAGSRARRVGLVDFRADLQNRLFHVIFAKLSGADKIGGPVVWLGINVY